MVLKALPEAPPMALMRAPTPLGARPNDAAVARLNRAKIGAWRGSLNGACNGVVTALGEAPWRALHNNVLMAYERRWDGVSTTSRTAPPVAPGMAPSNRPKRAANSAWNGASAAPKRHQKWRLKRALNGVGMTPEARPKRHWSGAFRSPTPR